MTHKRTDCCFSEPKTTRLSIQDKKDFLKKKITAWSLPVISDVNTEWRGWGYLKSDHRGCFTPKHFGSSVCHSHSWYRPTDPSLKTSSHHPSLTDMVLPPTVPREACHSNHWGGYRVLTALHYTHTHTHTIMMCEKAKISSNPANWDSHLFDPLGLVKSPATKSVSLQKQTFSYGKMSQNYKITE